MKTVVCAGESVFAAEGGLFCPSVVVPCSLVLRECPRSGRRGEGRVVRGLGAGGWPVCGTLPRSGGRHGLENRIIQLDFEYAGEGGGKLPRPAWRVAPVLPPGCRMNPGDSSFWTLRGVTYVPGSYHSATLQRGRRIYRRTCAQFSGLLVAHGSSKFSLGLFTQSVFAEDSGATHVDVSIFYQFGKLTLDFAAIHQSR